MNTHNNPGYKYDPELAQYRPATSTQGESALTNSHATFVNKVLNYVSIQLAITTLISSIMYQNRDSVIQKIQADPGLVWFPVVTSFISLCCMYFITSCRKPMFWIFTVACSFMVGMSVLSYAPDIVFMAVITTMLIVWIVNGYSYMCARQNRDLSFLEPLLLTGLFMLIIIGILNYFIKSSLAHCLITLFGVIIFTGFLLFDLNRLYEKGDRDLINEPMLAAVNIYLDIINLFLYLLELYELWFGKAE